MLLERDFSAARAPIREPTRSAREQNEQNVQVEHKEGEQIPQHGVNVG